MSDFPHQRTGEADDQPERTELSSEAAEVLRLCGIINIFRPALENASLPRRGQVGTVQTLEMFGREVVRTTIGFPQTITDSFGVSQRQIILGFLGDQPTHLGVANFQTHNNRYVTQYCDTHEDPDGFGRELNTMDTDTQLNFISALRQLGVVMGISYDLLYPYKQDQEEQEQAQ